jgi:probable rRNA maturation factor
MITITKTVKESLPLPQAFFINAHKKIMGEKYSLDLTFIGEKKAKAMNLKYRKKNYATDILSFTLEKNVGEIYINLEKARKKAKEFEKTFPEYLKFLFIHGLCHLKGMDHGSKMEKQEKKYLAIL